MKGNTRNAVNSDGNLFARAGAFGVKTHQFVSNTLNGVVVIFVSKGIFHFIFCF